MAGRVQESSNALPLFEGPNEARVRTWSQLIRTVHLLQRRIVSAMAVHEVTIPQFDILATLRFSEGVTQQELAERLLVTKGNVCGVIDRLERLGWMERRADPTDGRANRLYLTLLGRKKIQGLLEDHDALVLELLGPLNDGEVKTMRQLLAKLELALQ